VCLVFSGVMQSVFMVSVIMLSVLAPKVGIAINLKLPQKKKMMGKMKKRINNFAQ
jgi:hypothetical protein